jgi:hypothetical protein
MKEWIKLVPPERIRVDPEQIKRGAFPALRIAENMPKGPKRNGFVTVLLHTGA